MMSHPATTCSFTQLQSPVVLHPVNPTNDLASRMPLAGWAQWGEEAVRLMAELTRGVRSTLDRAVEWFQAQP